MIQFWNKKRVQSLKQGVCIALAGIFLFSTLAPSYAQTKRFELDKNPASYHLRARLQTMEQSSPPQRKAFENKVNSLMRPGSQNHEVLSSSLDPLLKKYQTTHRFFMHVAGQIKKISSHFKNSWNDLHFSPKHLKKWLSKNLWWEDTALTGTGIVTVVTSSHYLLLFALGIFIFLHVPNIARDWKQTKLKAVLAGKPVPNKIIWVTSYILSLIVGTTILQLALLAPIIALNKGSSPLLIGMFGLLALAVHILHGHYSRWFQDHPTFQIGGIALGVAPLTAVSEEDEGRYVVDIIDSPNWPEHPNNNFNAVLAFIYDYYAREFFSDPVTLQALAQKMQLDPNQPWNLRIKMIGDPLNSHHRSTFKIEIVATNLFDVKATNFAFKISTPYHPLIALAYEKGLMLMELDLSKRFSGEPIFSQHFTSTLVVKDFQIGQIGPLIKERFEREFSDFTAIYFQLDTWIEGKTLKDIFRQMDELGLPPEKKDAFSIKLAIQTITAALNGWKNLKTDKGGIIYDIGTDDVIISNFNNLEELAEMTDQNPVIFVDPNGGKEVGDELAMARALDKFLHELEKEFKLYFTFPEFSTLILTALGQEEGRKFLETLSQAASRYRLHPMYSSLFLLSQKLEMYIDQFLKDLPPKSKDEERKGQAIKPEEAILIALGTAGLSLTFSVLFTALTGQQLSTEWQALIAVPAIFMGAVTLLILLAGVIGSLVVVSVWTKVEFDLIYLSSSITKYWKTPFIEVQGKTIKINPNVLKFFSMFPTWIQNVILPVFRISVSRKEVEN